MPSALWDWDPSTMDTTRAMIHGAIEEACGEGRNVNRPEADTLIAQAQALGVPPLHLRTWIYDHHPRLGAADDWSAAGLEAWMQKNSLPQHIRRSVETDEPVVRLAKLAIAYEKAFRVYFPDPAKDLAEAGSAVLLSLGIRCWVSAYGDAITCVKCGNTSHNAKDVENRFCGACHEFMENGV